MENSTTISTSQRVREKKLWGNHTGVFIDDSYTLCRNESDSQNCGSRINQIMPYPADPFLQITGYLVAVPSGTNT
ncbi:hypothetical protein D3C73_1605670 [compost metagenome]